MLLKDRIKLVRTSLPGKITQEQFARMLGTSRPAITNYERGAVVPKDHFLKLICKEFHINESWLKDGLGEMRSHDDSTCLDKVKAISGLPAECHKLIDYYLSMEPPVQKTLLAMARELKNNDIHRYYLYCRAPWLDEADREDILKKMQIVESDLIAEKEANRFR